MFYEPASETTFDTIGDFKVAHLHTSFGQLDTEEERNSVGLFHVKQTIPAYDSEFFTIAETGIVEVDGLYEMSYAISPKAMSEAERDQRLLGRYTRALTEHMDTVAQQRRYDNRITCSLRAGYPSIFQAEGLAFAMWMDTCNAAAYQIWGEVKAGVRPTPESIEAFLALLPAMEWPPSPVVVPAPVAPPPPEPEPEVPVDPEPTEPETPTDPEPETPVDPQPEPDPEVQP